MESQLKVHEDFTDKERTVCFSGHRPEKLPDLGMDFSQVIRVIKSILYKEIVDSVDHGYNTFITGLARGVDLWAGQIVLELKAKGKDIRLVAAIPHKGFGKNYKGMEKFILGNILLKADEKVYLKESYTRGCMQIRNEYMVNRSGKLIAIVSNYKSGTGQTIRYAQNKKIITKVIDAAKLKDDVDRILSESECIF